MFDGGHKGRLGTQSRANNRQWREKKKEKDEPNPPSPPFPLFLPLMTQGSTTSVLTATTLIYAIGAGITAAAGTRLALQLFLTRPPRFKKERREGYEMR